jgi:hypothetical protein
VAAGYGARALQPAPRWARTGQRAWRRREGAGIGLVELNQSLVPTPSVELQKVLRTERSASCCISSSRLDYEMDGIPPFETFSFMGMPLMRSP